MDFNFSLTGSLTMQTHYTLGKYTSSQYFGVRFSNPGTPTTFFASAVLNIVTGNNPGIWSGTSGLASVLASVPFNVGTAPDANGGYVRVRFQQQGPVITAEAMSQVAGSRRRKHLLPRLRLRLSLLVQNRSARLSHSRNNCNCSMDF